MSKTLKMSEVKKLLNFTIDNNITLQENGNVPIALSIEATAGIGKTSIIEEVARDRGMQCVKLSLHEMDEPGDLLGFPEVRYECQIAKAKTDANGKAVLVDGKPKYELLPKTAFLTMKQIDSPTPGVKYRQTGVSKMYYAKPAWVPDYDPNGTIVIMDDYVRANPQLLQACMEFILTQKYTSWSLPKKTTIFLTNNPDNGSFNVNSLDIAQRSRFLNYGVAFDVNAWAEWAERAKVDSRCINFVMQNHEALFNEDAEGNIICNPRSFVMFARMIQGVNDWDSDEGRSFINMIASGCFFDENDRFAKMFDLFIKAKMHLIITPEKMLKGAWNDVKAELEALLYDNGGNRFRPEIASLLEKRFANYVNAWLESDSKTPVKTVVDRLLQLRRNNKTLFTEDHFYHMIKSITSQHKNQTRMILMEPELARVVNA